jgi:hypothetical protein
MTATATQQGPADAPHAGGAAPRATRTRKRAAMAACIAALIVFIVFGIPWII